MTGLQEFFSMGGYGAYIWSAYAVTFIVLAANLILARRDFQSKLQNARRQQNRQAASNRDNHVSSTATTEPGAVK